MRRPDDIELVNLTPDPVRLLWAAGVAHTYPPAADPCRAEPASHDAGDLGPVSHRVAGPPELDAAPPPRPGTLYIVDSFTALAAAVAGRWDFVCVDRSTAELNFRGEVLWHRGVLSFDLSGPAATAVYAPKAWGTPRPEIVEGGAA
jgi:hypothetical protein